MVVLKQQFSSELRTGVFHTTLPNGIKIHTRDNLNIVDLGLNVKSIEDFYTNAAKPQINYHVRIRAGAHLDPEHRPGLMHFLEHCLIQTAEYPSHDLLQEAFEERGGFVNAYTALDEMVLHGAVDSTPENLDFITKYLQEALGNPHITQQIVERERYRILTEFLEYEDSAQKRVNEKLFSNIRNAAGKPIDILGSEISVETVTRDELIVAHQQSFNGSNIEVALTSNLQPISVMDKLSRALEGVKAGKPTDITPVNYDLNTIVTLDEPSSKSANFAVWLNAGKQDYNGLVQLSAVSKLLHDYFYQEMINKGVVYGCGAQFSMLGHNAGIMLTGKLRSDAVAAITPTIISTLEKFQSGISDYRYKKAKENTVKIHSGKIYPSKLFDDNERHGEFKTFRANIEGAREGLSPENLFKFVRNNIVPKPVSISINGGENTKLLTDTLPTAMAELNERMQSASFEPRVVEPKPAITKRLTGLVFKGK